MRGLLHTQAEQSCPPLVHEDDQCPAVSDPGVIHELRKAPQVMLTTKQFASAQSLHERTSTIPPEIMTDKAWKGNDVVHFEFVGADLR
jgi:hypothetical protein